MKIRSKLLGVLILLSLFSFFSGCDDPQQVPSNEALDAFEWDWDNEIASEPRVLFGSIDQLVNEQKYQKALEKLEPALKKFQKEDDRDNWTRALIKMNQLRFGLGQTETATLEFKKAPWPNGNVHRGILQLFYAQTLLNYLNQYNWEINQRQPVQSQKELPLKQWTSQEIIREVEKTLEPLWLVRARLQEFEINELKEFLKINNYGPGVRSSLRDLLTYYWVELYQNSSYWTPAENNALKRLKVSDLTSPEPQLSKGSRHPLEKMVSMLYDLEAGHVEREHPAGEIEARFKRLEILHQHFTDQKDRAQIRTSLKEFLAEITTPAQELPWKARGLSLYATMLNSASFADAKIQALDVAQKCINDSPESIGVKKCREVSSEILRAEFRLDAMDSDQGGRRSLRVNFRNVKKLYFKAFKIDLYQLALEEKNYSFFPNGHQWREKIKSMTPVKAWEEELPAVQDYREHQHYLTPQTDQFGSYLIVVSAKPEFTPEDNQIVGFYHLHTDLILAKRKLQGDQLEVQVLKSDVGRPESGVQVDLVEFDWRNGHSVTQSKKTDDQGRVLFEHQPGKVGSQTYGVFARKGPRWAIDHRRSSIYRVNPARDESRALIFLDRSVYRPDQEVQFKVLAYRGQVAESKFRSDPKRKLTATLYDLNGEKVRSIKLTTNSFGTASGKFKIPSGRALGSWRISTDSGGSARLLVEEYKRPTFELALDVPQSTMSLGQKVELTGTAKYYFGLPLTEGKGRFTVTREFIAPYWWGWYGGPFFRSLIGYYPDQAEVLAQGSTSLNDQGQFKIEFLAQNDPRSVVDNQKYRFRVEVELTHSSGETRTVSKSYVIGQSDVQAQLTMPHHFILGGSESEVSVDRQSLNGMPMAGKGNWKLFELKQPKTTLLPSEEPFLTPALMKKLGDRTKYFIQGDYLRPRWTQYYRPEATLEAWEPTLDPQQLGKLTHNEKGRAKINLGSLEPGAYRLVYYTQDEKGAAYQTHKNIIVSPAKAKILEPRPLALPLVLMSDRSSAQVGEWVDLYLGTGFQDQTVALEFWRAGKLLRSEIRQPQKQGPLVQFRVRPEWRGGIQILARMVRDHQKIQLQKSLFIPWDNKELQISFSRIREKIETGTEQNWEIVLQEKSKSGKPIVLQRSAEVLAFMYDRSLDAISPYQLSSHIYQNLAHGVAFQFAIDSQRQLWIDSKKFSPRGGGYVLQGDQLQFYPQYAIGGMGLRGAQFGGAGAPMEMAENEIAPMSSVGKKQARRMNKVSALADKDSQPKNENSAQADSEITVEQNKDAPQVRSNFSETAFWIPHLQVSKKGKVKIKFRAPESVTAWNFWLHAVSDDLRIGTAHRKIESLKNLMARPYLPRFLREGDQATIKTVINNASEKKLQGEWNFEIWDQDQKNKLHKEFKIDSSIKNHFAVEALNEVVQRVDIEAPRELQLVTVKTWAKAGDFTDGEIRKLPILPSRVRLAQSRFVALSKGAQRTVQFEDLKKKDDPTRINESMIVTIDAQLFYSVLGALPYLLEYPYQSTDVTLNRFVATGILARVYKKYPQIAQAAQSLSLRKTQWESWDKKDPNLRLALEEAPWLKAARGGQEEKVLSLLREDVVQAELQNSLRKLQNLQTANGAFSWWKGGPPSPMVTLGVVYGLSKAVEFGVSVPKTMVVRAFQYLASEYRNVFRSRMLSKNHCCVEFLTLFNYTVSNFKDPTWTGGAVTKSESDEILEYSFKHWKEHSPYLKGMLALTLSRRDRRPDAKLVFDSVMDSAKTDRDLGTYWAPEDRSWLWYNDTIESHAFALRTLSELEPKDSRREGLVHWLFLNKKLNHWKSTRATSEVMYSLVHYLSAEEKLGVREAIQIDIGAQSKTFEFDPKKYTGSKNQWVHSLTKAKDASSFSQIQFRSKAGSLAFASATWHFSTEKLPETSAGDLLSVKRRFFKVLPGGAAGEKSQPLSEAGAIELGDQIEVQLDLRAKHAAQYIHLRDPRPAGFEPGIARSGSVWELGIYYNRQIKDSGTHFFIEQLPAGQYTLKYRYRAATAGQFAGAPATLQSLFAPEFTAYSAGQMFNIVQEK